ncbi:MAG TPA: GNAT family N-acetyltransferase [Armatimonadota bacterium]
MVGPEIAGRTVNLRPLKADDLQRRAEWLNDLETVRFFTGCLPTRAYDMNDAQRWQQNLENDVTALVWAIETKDRRHIGDIDLHSIDRYYKSAKLTIMIGDKTSWNQGFGTDAIVAMLDHAFSELRMLNIDLRVFDFNARALRCYEKCGFAESNTPSPGQMGASESGEVYMTISRERYFARRPDATAVQS